MKKELQNKLYEKYPKIFRQKDLDKTQTAMCWGISCDDGWYNIIDTLCESLQELVDQPRKDIARYNEWINKELEKPQGEQNKAWIKRCEGFILESSKKGNAKNGDTISLERKTGSDGLANQFVVRKNEAIVWFIYFCYRHCIVFVITRRIERYCGHLIYTK